MESSSFSASAIRLSMTAWKNLSVLPIVSSCGLDFFLFLGPTLDFVFFRDIFDSLLSYLEDTFSFREVRA